MTLQAELIVVCACAAMASTVSGQASRPEIVGSPDGMKVARVTDGSPIPGQDDRWPEATSLTPEWVSRHSGVVGFFFGFNVPVKAITDDQGAVYVAGSTDDNPSTDIVTIKYAADGTQVWAVTYNGPSDFGDAAKAIAMDSAGDILVLGASECDFLVIKYDASDGSMIWSNQHDGGNCPERATAFTTDDAGNIYVTGSTRPSGGDHQEDFYTYKLDSAGNVLWTATFDGPGVFLVGNDIPADIALDSNNDVIVTGPSNDPGGSPDFVTIKYSGTDGTQLWNSRLAIDETGESVELIINSEDDIYVTGASSNGFTPFTTVKYDGNDGSELWVSVNDYGIFGHAFGMALDSGGDVYITGRLDPDGNRSNQNDNVITMRLRAEDGRRQWVSIYGETVNLHRDEGLAIVIDDQDHVFVSGSTSSFGSINDLLLLQYDAGTGQLVNLGIHDIPTEWAQGQTLTLDSAQNIIVTGTTTADPSGFMDLLTIRYQSLLGCPADLNGDGKLDFFDVNAFLTAYAAQDPSADFTGDGVWDFFDVAEFLVLFNAGCG